MRFPNHFNERICLCLLAGFLLFAHDLYSQGLPEPATEQVRETEVKSDAINTRSVENIICPPDHCTEESPDLVVTDLAGKQHRYADMTRNQWIDLQKSTLELWKGQRAARGKGIVAFQRYLAQHTPLAIRGKPTSKESFLTSDNMIQTNWIVESQEVLVGTLASKTLTLVTPGGCVDGGKRCETPLNCRLPSLGKESVFLLIPIDGKRWTLLDLQEGVYEPAAFQELLPAPARGSEKAP